MLGWEFPPIINGGLGVACHDLSGALSEMADVTMVVPKSSLGYKVKRVNLVGINNVDVSALAAGPAQGSFPFRLFSIPVNLDPYYADQADSMYAGVKKNAAGIEGFDIDNLYGGDVIGKVYRFSEVTAALARKMSFDVIHAHDWMTMIAGMRIKHETGKPLVMHIHSLEVDRSGPESRGWVYELEKAGMEYADLIMPVSNFTADNIHEHYGIPREKMFVVHNGSNYVQSFRTEKPYKEKTVLFVGRLTRQKGPEKFLDIAARVLERNPDVRFVMAGVGDYFRSLIEQSSYRHIGNRFHMTGFLNTEKLRQLLSFADVYCMPSVSEPFGLSAVEAAQFGIPCVISKQSGVAEVLHGALTFDFWDVNKAADYILNLLNDPVLSSKVAADASRSLERISWDFSARNVMQGYAHKQLI
jgi:glycogen synthase